VASQIAERIRNALNQNRIVGSAALVLVILAMLMYTVWSLGYFGRHASRDAATPTKAFFMDEETGEISVHPANEIPPLLGKSGKPTVVRAFFFTASTNAARKMVFLQRYSLEAKQAMDASHNGQRLSPEEMSLVVRGPQVRAPEPNSPWHDLATLEGQAIVNSVSDLDPDRKKIHAVNP